MIEARIRASIEAYVAAWNERDATARMRLLEHACGEDFFFRTPSRQIRGRTELDALIADFQQRMPGHRAIFTTGIDVQGQAFRFAGVVETPSGASAGEAFDAGECDDDGRIRVLLTFVGAALPVRA